MSRKKNEAHRVCGDCIHESACFYAGGGCGSLTNTDATHCVNFTKLSDYLAKYAPLFGYKKDDRAEDLKCCPFCGPQETVHLMKYAGKDGFRDRYAVLCDYVDGGCVGESGMYHSQEEAIAAWNTRSEQ